MHLGAGDRSPRGRHAVSHVHGLWHADFHHGSLPVLRGAGERVRPSCLGPAALPGWRGRTRPALPGRGLAPSRATPDRGSRRGSASRARHARSARHHLAEPLTRHRRCSRPTRRDGGLAPAATAGAGPLRAPTPAQRQLSLPVDENASGAAVPPFPAFLRELQRRHALAVVVVHDALKNGSGARPGQARRGSSELHAWGDANRYLRRCGEQLLLCIEHRAAVGRDDIALALRARGDALALELTDEEVAPAPRPRATAAERVRDALANTDVPLALADLRAASALRKTTLCQVLAELQAAGIVRRVDSGYRLADIS